jgi:hypothetical protein
VSAAVRVLDPSRMPERDEHGWALHPDLENLVVDGPEGADLPLDPVKLREAGFEASFCSLEDDAGEGDPEWEQYFGRGEAACSEWTPTPPSGNRWYLVAVWDTDDGDGPCAMFVRPLA